MNTRRDRQSPWGVRVYFDGNEFEAMMEDLLYRAEPDVFEVGKGVDVDRVLLRAFRIEADYIALPSGILGRTLFRRTGSAHIQISRALAEKAELDQLARRRLRTTLAHECGHVACHQQLFVGDTETGSLFDHAEVPPEKPAILCRENAVGVPGYTGQWWEYQANQCMAALLLPKRLFTQQVKALLDGAGISTFLDAVTRGSDEELIRALANTFDVSWQAVLLRLQELDFLPGVAALDQRQMALGN